MGGVVLPIAGAAGGFMLGGLSGAIKGAVIGGLVGNAFSSQKKYQTVSLPTQHGPKLSDLRIQLSSYGEIIPQVYGRMRVAGNVIWCTNIKERANEHTTENMIVQRSRGKGGGGGKSYTTQRQTTITYTYYVTLAIAICKGVVDEISHIWADGCLLQHTKYGENVKRYNIHLGSAEQLPDDIMSQYIPLNMLPAHRGLCYVVIEDFPLEKFGNRIPNFTFEVKRKLLGKPAIEEKITEVVLIPGAGEFVYSNIVHEKKANPYVACADLDITFPSDYHDVINCNNPSGRADVLLALEQMAETLPNLKWVALVITWFATDLDAGKCQIVPKVEYHTHDTDYVIPRDWQVAGVSRNQAMRVMAYKTGLEQFKDVEDLNLRTYGGTPSDDSVVQICQELRSRGYQILLYPMIFVDDETRAKPWRGRIRANSREDIDSFFNGRGNYNRFIRHYANLTKGMINGIIIGSEMIKLTSYSDYSGSYPAVRELVNLAAQVKGIVEEQVVVTYGADWSEYHHTKGGWFNLDELWSCPYIDVIGIDAYFPLSDDLTQSAITDEKIRGGWESGEGWDYYYRYDNQIESKVYFADETPHEVYKYAWKNLEYWWSNYHQNPDGHYTSWTPRLKPVWFTEFGFPSVDCAANQPNVFYDPLSVESYFPRKSTGRVSFLAQKQALNATIDYLRERNEKPGLANLVSKRFVWTYDARPFPYWPDYKEIWYDCNLWATGHWINGKLGISSLAAVVANILEMAGLKKSQYDVTRLKQDIEGYVINQGITIREALEQLQAAYFFDIVESDGQLKFVPKSEVTNSPVINRDELVINGNNKSELTITIKQELELPAKVGVSFFAAGDNYDIGKIVSQRQVVQTKEQVELNLPLVLSNHIAKQIADSTLYNAWQERRHYNFSLPTKYCYIEPSDVITLQTQEGNQQMRIVSSTMSRNGVLQLSAVSYSSNSYDFYDRSNYDREKIELTGTEIARSYMKLLDLPPLPVGHNEQATIYAAVMAETSEKKQEWRYANIYSSIDETIDYEEVTATQRLATIGVVVGGKLELANSCLQDNYSSITVKLIYGKLNSVNRLSLLAGNNSAMIGNELIQFEKAELLEDNNGNKVYRLSKLLRGRQGTEWAMNEHQDNEIFVLLNNALVDFTIDSGLIGKELLYKVVSGGIEETEVEGVKFTYRAKKLKPLAPVHIKAEKTAEVIKISWIRRSRVDGGWQDLSEVELGESEEKYEIEIKSGANVLRVITTNTASLDYSIDEQITDQAKEQYARYEPLMATIYQMSSRVGRGYPATIALPR